jgi:hypothetical protein
MSQMDNNFTFNEHGFEEVKLSRELSNDIQKFYFDIIRYWALVLRDSDKKFFKYADKLENILETKSINKIDPIFQNSLLEVSEIDRGILGSLYEMGTCPNKFLSGEKLFFNPAIIEKTNEFFTNNRNKANQEEPLLVKPYKGETLHVFTPGKSQFKYNLPIHQDYQYLGQSSDQLTYWLFLTGRKETGGVRVFPGTHKFGIAKCTQNDHGHHKVTASQYPDFDANYFEDFGGKQFQLLALNSLTWHQSLRSVSEDSVRLTYIWRISNLNSCNRVLKGASF